MSLAQMKERCPQSNKIGIGELRNYVLSFPRFSRNRKCGVSSLEKQEGQSVCGVLFEVTDSDLSSLDENEGYQIERDSSKNSYNRNDIVIRLGDCTDLNCFTYVAYPQEGQHKPNEAYKKLIVDGASENNLPDDYLTFLKNIITC
jgi:gamma-glutamylcyclotransferase